ncbi:MAG: hypothetical protein IJ563_09735 [Selenomonadaceae bacterium]|nr:hypothetical protein [Selenomonadaceae bacterium]
MVNLKIIAVGSSLLIADEIKSIILTLLGNEIPIRTLATPEVKSVSNNTFYVCATTQKVYLQNIIPDNQLFIFDLHPTTKFFLDIAKIPAGEKVYVFNNLMTYTQLLAKECCQLGINNLKFQPIAYDEMPNDIVHNLLREANYIIGVDCLMGDKMLFSDKYLPSLQKNVNIIAGKRAASVSSASHFISAIADFYYNHLIKERNAITKKISKVDSTAIYEQITNLSAQINRIINFLRYAANQAITNQIGLTSNLTDNRDSNELPLIDMDYLNEQLNMLKYLCHKMQQFSTAS